jgi:hypothetical protein
MEKRRWNYARIAEGVAVLGAQLTGVGVPIGPGMTLYRALRGEGVPADREAFVRRFLDEVDRRCQEPHNRIVDGDPNPPRRVTPLTTLLRDGLDSDKRYGYFLHEEEGSRAKDCA